MKRLNLGSGNDYRSGWVNVEVIPSLKGDVRHNLEKYPYPFKANTFDEIRASNILEHLTDPIKALKEIIRIARPGAKLVVIVPHAHSYSAVGDLQHKHFFTEHTFAPLLLQEYGLEGLRLDKVSFISSGNINSWKKYIPLKRFLKIFFLGMYDEIQFDFTIKKKN